ncbi:hypothetical protein ABSP09_004621 [Salmonella enterica subsp. enterica serovar Typhimurium]|uniref:Uncharacterized protein n=4 Tax=Salmonella enterica TaxID=28901 RepID=A0A5U1ANZ3_SALER|nr:hypothetical protein [Salmonella enterica]EAA5994838.1 hypothetical protein [Salmonella enterica subsp. enterica serovar Chester]EAA7335296.1 hypothetical protein [Salmonella enterica subsp. enterica]EBQ9001587.1 hypothetical protein [Salmonella enterica subsp. enterica serovar Blockley]EBV5831059.1 hypothetical protein [Salmonella enterica subsp. enterica serovar Carmel]EBV9368848.1 hypothetical protein [Salmonella enterica subsp. enterica serovar Sandiego]EBY1765862.1 hypothetical protei
MNEQTVNLLKDITERVGWKLTKKIVGEPLGVTSVGLDPFIARLQATVETEQEAVAAHIGGVWRNLLLSGTRLVKLYKLQANEIQTLRNAIVSLNRDDSLFCQNYPYPLSREELLTADTDLHYLETVSTVFNGVSLETSILTSKAYYTETIELDASHLSDSGLVLRSNGGEIKCKTREVTQCFNTVMILPELQLVALTIDLSVMPRSESERQQFLLDQFVRNVSGLTFPSPIDLFGLVQEMYEQVDGRISQMAFLTSDGNTSSLKLRPGESCLRTDSYHHGGEEASPILTKYKLGKIWDLTDSASQIFPIELILPGKRAMIDKPNSHLYDAIIDRCSSVEHILFVINKMLESLTSLQRKRGAAEAA